MKRTRNRGIFTCLLAAAFAALGTLWWATRPDPARATRSTTAADASGRSPPVASSPSDHAFTPGPPPVLLPPRRATPEAPTLSWERLLAADGSPAEDLAALADLVASYHQSSQGERRRSLGFNEDLVIALSDRAALGDTALPPGHPALRDGRLLDRWGTPWQVHPLVDDLIELRSAGPDQRLYTADDLTTP